MISGWDKRIERLSHIHLGCTLRFVVMCLDCDLILTQRIRAIWAECSFEIFLKGLLG